MSGTSTDCNLKSGKFDQDDDLEIEIFDTIGQVSSRDWNRMIPSDSPFLRHEFLHALEHSKCVAPDTGWVPQHIVIRNSNGKRREVIGVTPLYLKGHSWGEFIFDWDWAHGYQRHGLNYYLQTDLANAIYPGNLSQITGQRQRPGYINQDAARQNSKGRRTPIRCVPQFIGISYPSRIRMHSNPAIF